MLPKMSANPFLAEAIGICLAAWKGEPSMDVLDWNGFDNLMERSDLSFAFIEYLKQELLNNEPINNEALYSRAV